MAENYSIADKRYDSILRRSCEEQLKMVLYCKVCLEKSMNQELKTYIDYEIPKDAIKEFKKPYFRDPDTKEKGLKGIRERNRIIRKWKDTHKNEVKFFKKAYKEYFKKQLSMGDFRKIYGKNDENRKCEYCEITENDIRNLTEKKQIKTKRYYIRGETMEVDRKDPNRKYEKNNIILTCYWCNNAKTDEFSYCEFKKIGKTMKIIWDKRLGQKIGGKK